MTFCELILIFTSLFSYFVLFIFMTNTIQEYFCHKVFSIAMFYNAINNLFLNYQKASYMRSKAIQAILIYKLRSTSKLRGLINTTYTHLKVLLCEIKIYYVKLLFNIVT